MLSIIIPTYNSAKTLAATLDSVVNQTYTNFEVLIIDGLSNDSTISIAKSYNDERIKIISEKDAGIYDAMNKGIQLAKGEWLYFLGSDDELYDENVLQSVSDNFETENEIVYGNVNFKSSGFIYGGAFTISDLLYKRNICHQAIFFNRKVFNKVGLFNLKYKLWADWDFNIRCFKNTLIKIEFVNVIIATYNDGFGKSGVQEDLEFKKELPVFYISQLEILNAKLDYISEFQKKNKMKLILKIILNKKIFY